MLEIDLDQEDLELARANSLIYPIKPISIARAIEINLTGSRAWSWLGVDKAWWPIKTYKNQYVTTYHFADGSSGSVKHGRAKFTVNQTKKGLK